METPTDRSQTPQEPERSPRTAGDPAICDPGYHVSGPWCSRCGQWFVDGEWRNTPPETTRSPRAAGGFVSGPQPVLIGEKDGPWLSLADHVELARGKTPQAEIEATADTPIDPADIHSDDAMLSAVISEGITPLTPVAEEIRVVLNRYSAEAPSGTPDYILANYLIDCLKAFNEAVSLRSVWRGEPIEQTTLHIDKEL